MTLGEKIKSLRKVKDISQEKLAEILGVHITNIGRYETNKQLPSAENIRKLAEYFEVTADYLLFDNPTSITTTKIKDKELMSLFEKIEEMPNEEVAAIKMLLDAMVSKYQIKQMVS
jgi:transcriptional regulator with XRE-family HTH domain